MLHVSYYQPTVNATLIANSSAFMKRSQNINAYKPLERMSPVDSHTDSDYVKLALSLYLL